MNKTIFDHKVKDIQDNDVDMSKYRGNTILIVNVAGLCAFTNQYKELEEIYQIYRDQGLRILAFPCNQFGEQEPEKNSKIKEFCEARFNITFDLFSKIDVNGDNESPLFTFLKESMPGLLGSRKIKWNFTKFLIDKNGNSIKRYSPQYSPLKMAKDIKNII
jgi:glutathione peroxidase